MFDLSLTLRQRGSLEEAEAAALIVLELRAAFMPPAHAYMIRTRGEWAEIVAAAGRVEEADLETLRMIADTRQATGRGAKSALANALVHRGRVLGRTRRQAEAVPIWRECATLMKRGTDEDARMNFELAVALLAANEGEEAKRVMAGQRWYFEGHEAQLEERARWKVAQAAGEILARNDDKARTMLDSAIETLRQVHAEPYLIEWATEWLARASR